ncbi:MULTISPECIES: ABC transporter permease [Methanohalophilus]|nr:MULTISPECIES: ABC transporter permease [Methanohalophilus]KXS45451.1 MAG: ABC-2 type transport system permease protein [Methanohalophilus sp. T328-1]OBZ34276.1 MAG: sugar ABC transporter permease [Methanohalophilus sp. DAL1]PQV43142.1 lipopolysaccharide transport system permease protein [Methanohalophilus euhalobius]
MVFKHLNNLYAYRELIWQLAWSEFKLRYKNSILGYFWSLLEPMLMLTVLYVVFSNLMRVQVEYFQLFLLLGIILWNFLSRATSIGMNSIVGKADMIKKIYFPRDIFVISSCITALLMSIFESLIFISFMAIFRVPISTNLIYVPFILIFLFFISLGLTLALAALNVFYRDVQFIWQVILQAGFFATPILYTIDIFPAYLQKIVLLNPVAIMIISARHTIIYSSPATVGNLTFMLISSVIFLIMGYVIFNRLEPRFAEEI